MNNPNKPFADPLTNKGLLKTIIKREFARVSVNLVRPSSDDINNIIEIIEGAPAAEREQLFRDATNKIVQERLQNQKRLQEEQDKRPLYTSFKIKNFRGFKDLSIESLDRINLITGKNNVGKTALLEAIYLHMAPANAQLALRINHFRGIEHFKINAQDIWGWSFYGGNTNETFELISRDTKRTTRSLKARLGKPKSTRSLALTSEEKRNSDPLAALTEDPRDLMMTYEESTGFRGEIRIFIEEKGLQIEQTRPTPLQIGAFLTTRARFFQEDAARFSDLERVGHHEPIIPIIQLLEKRIKRLSVLVTGGVALINGDVGIGSLIPVPLMGEGVARLLSIVLAIMTFKRSVILIDEIENGLHYSTLVDVWKAIAKAARESDAQIFATTHSWECIKAAHQAFSEMDLYDFSLHRLERIRGAEDIRVITYDQESLDGSMETGLEIR